MWYTKDEEGSRASGNLSPSVFGGGIGKHSGVPREHGCIHDIAR